MANSLNKVVQVGLLGLVRIEIIRTWESRQAGRHEVTWDEC